MYIIIKKVNGMPVVLLQGEEVWEFSDSKSAQDIADILTQNSTHGYTYEVKKV